MSLTAATISAQGRRYYEHKGEMSLNQEGYGLSVVLRAGLLCESLWPPSDKVVREVAIKIVQECTDAKAEPINV
jgi:hypothetical protein